MLHARPQKGGLIDVQEDIMRERQRSREREKRVIALIYCSTTHACIWGALLTQIYIAARGKGGEPYSFSGMSFHEIDVIKKVEI